MAKGITKRKASKKKRAPKRVRFPIFPGLVRARKEPASEANTEAGAEAPSLPAGKKAAEPVAPAEQVTTRKKPQTAKKSLVLRGKKTSVAKIVQTAKKSSVLRRRKEAAAREALLAKKAPASASQESESFETGTSEYTESPLEKFFRVVFEKVGFPGNAAAYKSSESSSSGDDSGDIPSPVEGVTVELASVMLERANDVVGSIYWDLNCIAHFRKIVSNGSTDQDRTIYQNLWNGTKIFIDRTVHNYLKPGDNVPRCSAFTKRFGWRLFAICAHSDAFRIAFLKHKDANWAAVTAIIADNQRSLQVYARTNDVEWRGPLLVHAQHPIPGLREALGPEMNLAVEHPHHTARTLDGHLRRPRHKGKAQVNINTLHYTEGLSQPYPSSREGKTDWGSCTLCKSDNICDCRVTAMSGDLMELVEYPNKGIGVRALTQIQEGEILGEYLGVLEDKEETTDQVYCIAVTALNEEKMRWENDVAGITAKELGNWTRYMNHSCEPSTWWRPVTCGDRVGQAIVTERTIDAFEELTIDYGAFYWGDDGCPCGSKYCHNPRQSAG